MTVAIVTGSGGLVGSETVRHLCGIGLDVVGVDNDMRRVFFGQEASTDSNSRALVALFPKTYRHLDIDIRNRSEIEGIFRKYGCAIDLVVHTAAQPSHDWAAREPLTDFEVNATGTLILLEAARQHCPEATFIFTSTNKVYGDLPNALPLVEKETRWEIEPTHRFVNGIDESMSIDTSTHSIFGASKVAADVLVQEYGRYFGMKTACFRGGCLTGPQHAGTALHGFLAYLMKCICTGRPYTVYGYKGKQVRDNIHSEDLVDAFVQFHRFPRQAEVYNIGGSRFSNCSMLEAIALGERIAGRKLNWTYAESNRIGDHIWYISDTAKFRAHYPEWRQRFGLEDLVKDIFEKNVERWLWQGGKG
jgi:CDP-paratose 2-epimerase